MYRYRVESTFTPLHGEETSRSTDESDSVGQPVRDGASVVQTVTRTQEDGHHRVQTLVWDSGDVVVTVERIRETGETWTDKPPLVILRFPLRVGDSWPYRTSTDGLLAGGGRRKTETDGVARVERRQKDDVGGRVVDVVVLAADFTTTIRDFDDTGAQIASFVWHTVSKSDLLATDGLITTSFVTVDVTGTDGAGSGNYTSTRRRTLLNLTPDV